MALKLITPGASEPITLEEAKAHLRVEGTEDDAYITSLIVAARQSAESLTGRALMPQTWELALDEFPRSCAHDYRSLGRYQAAIDIPMPPLVSIESIKYVDADGTLQTMDNSARQVDDYNQPARVVPAYGTTWPATRCQPNAVLIRFQCGYENAGEVPQEIKAWMLLRIGMLYENRESVAAGVTLTELPHVDRLLDAYRVWGA